MQFVLDDWEPGRPILDAVDTDGSAPVVTQAAMEAFVAHWRSVDPNGNWGEVHVLRDHGGRMCLTRSDSDDPDDWAYFPEVGPDRFAVRGWGFHAHD